MTIMAYVQGLTTKFDQISLLGKPLDHEDQIDHIIAGQPEDYKPVIDQIESRETPPSITEVHERLLNQELCLQTAATQSILPTLITANAVNYRPNNNNTSNSTNWNLHNNSPILVRIRGLHDLTTVDVNCVTSMVTALGRVPISPLMPQPSCLVLALLLLPIHSHRGSHELTLP